MKLKEDIKSYTGRIYGRQGEEVKVIRSTEYLSLVESVFQDRYYVTTDKLTDEFVAPKTEAVPDTTATINNRALVLKKKAAPINNDQRSIF